MACVADQIEVVGFVSKILLPIISTRGEVKGGGILPMITLMQGRLFLSLYNRSCQNRYKTFGANLGSLKLFPKPLLEKS